jgi:Mg2+/citrate symporter
VNAQVIPTSFTEKALEDQMVSTFLDVQVAQHTVVVISFYLEVFFFSRFYLEVFLFSRFLEFILSLKRRQMKIFNLFVTLAFHIHLKGSGASMNLNLRA